MILLLLLACRQGDDTGPTWDTGWFTKPGEACPDQVVSLEPGDGTLDWYWRAYPRVKFEGEAVDAYTVRLLDQDGVEVPTVLAVHGQRIDVTFQGGLAPLSDYLLEVTDCDSTERAAFHTSHYGLPLEAAPSSLVGRSYVFDMTRATWDEPASFGSVLALYFTSPVLVGVQWADGAMLDLVGALGYQTDLGEIKQDLQQPSWDFPVAAFDERPYFEARAEKVRFQFDAIPIDVYEFRLSGTFSADGGTIGGTKVSGLGDTRNMGDILGKKGDPRAMCDLAMAWSVPCEPCPDGGSYCMRLSARDALGVQVPGLSIRHVASE